MKLSLSQPVRPFVIIATDPDAEWRIVPLKVNAISAHEAKRVVREALKIRKLDHWSLKVLGEPVSVRLAA